MYIPGVVKDITFYFILWTTANICTSFQQYIFQRRIECRQASRSRNSSWASKNKLPNVMDDNDNTTLLSLGGKF